MSTDMNLKQVNDPFERKEIEDIRSDTYNVNVTLQYVAMMSDVDLSFLNSDEPEYQPDEGVMVMSDLDEEKPRSAKFNIAVAWWQLWHSETVIQNAVEKGWITEEEAQQIMSM